MARNGTRATLSASRLFREYGLFALGALILAGLAIRMSLNAPETRRAFHGLLLRTPMVGGLIRKIEGGRFARLFSTLIGAGLPAATAGPPAVLPPRTNQRQRRAAGCHAASGSVADSNPHRRS